MGIRNIHVLTNGCDICDGTLIDYIGRPCRVCNPASPHFEKKEQDGQRTNSNPN